MAHSKKTGIVYTGNMVTDVYAGLSAGRQGVQQQWRIGKVAVDTNAAMLRNHGNDMRVDMCLGMCLDMYLLHDGGP